MTSCVPSPRSPFSPLCSMAATSVARVSDDFYPRDPASSHPHVAACAFNGLFMSVLVQPDWDMFHSKHVAAQLHAMARWEGKEMGLREVGQETTRKGREG